MCLVVFPFAEAIVSLLLFNNVVHDRADQLHQFPRPSPSLGVAKSVVASKVLHRSQDDVISRDVASSSSVDGIMGGPEYAWNLRNGKVQFERPFSFAGISMQDGKLESDYSSSSRVSLWGPTFLGSGGSGAVFSFSTNPNNDNNKSNKEDLDGKNNVAIKVSWKRSRDSVENECNILQSLDNVPHVERCLGRPNPYPYEDGRVMIALAPVVAPSTATDGIASSLKDVNPGRPQRNAAREVVETMIGMLRLGIYTIDVQPLVSVETGEVLFIDFTEARHFSRNSLSSFDESALVGFCSEMSTLIPDSLKNVAADYLRAELKDGTSNNNGEMMLPEKVADIVESIWIE